MIIDKDGKNFRVVWFQIGSVGGRQTNSFLGLA